MLWQCESYYSLLWILKLAFLFVVQVRNIYSRIFSKPCACSFSRHVKKQKISRYHFKFANTIWKLMKIQPLVDIETYYPWGWQLQKSNTVYENDVIMTWQIIESSTFWLWIFQSSFVFLYSHYSVIISVHLKGVRWGIFVLEKSWTGLCIKIMLQVKIGSPNQLFYPFTPVEPLKPRF